jgi:hypothetical protein
MEKYEQQNGSRKKIFINNFIGGIAWAFGVTVGLSLVVAILTPILKHVNLIPSVGSFVANVMQFVADKNPNLLGR